MTRPCHGSTKPDAGVIVPRPATAPEMMPSTDGLPRIHPFERHPGERAGDAARCVAMIANAARELAASAEPPLKPNQPTHSNPVPITASDRS